MALGGSAIFLASELDGDRCFEGYDVFGMIPPPSDRDGDDVKQRYQTIVEGRSSGIGGDVYYGYRDDLYDAVVGHFARNGVPVDGARVRLTRGLFEDTLLLAPERRVAIAHIDCDWHDPVTLCLERIASHVAPGGFIVADDYNHYSGCRTAIDAFVASRSDFRVQTLKPHAVLQKL